MQSKTAGIIYANRKLKNLTQEQLADEVGVSAVAVSKWERGISIPNVDVLCRLADCFHVTVDELLGRGVEAVQENDLYSREVLERLTIGEQLVRCCEVSRKEGLLAMEQLAKKEDVDTFLRFSITFLLDSLQKGITTEHIFQMLRNYAQNESCKENAGMIAEVLTYIVAGENEEYIREWLASFVGREYRVKFVTESARRQLNREEILASYNGLHTRYASTNLLEEFLVLSDEQIRFVLKNVDNQTLTAALSGASGECCKKVLANLSERLLHYIDEDIRQYEGTENEVLEAQKKVLEIKVCSWCSHVCSPQSQNILKSTEINCK